MLRARWMVVGASSLLFGAACSETTAPPPLLPACTAGRGFAVALAVDSFVAVDPIRDSGCVIFPANGSVIDSAEYLLVPLSGTGTPGVTASFVLSGDTVHPPAAAAAAVAFSPSLSAAEQFHQFLRDGERQRWYGFVPQAGGGPAAPAPAFAASTPPDSGSVRTFSVCDTLTCATFARVTATAKVVRGHIALYVDNAAPVNGLTQADLDTLADVFNARLYPLDTTAFGRESDIDNNGVVDVLMTNVVNKLVSTKVCKSSGFVAGFFFGADIDPSFAGDSRVNHGEVFYSIVPDSAGTLSCTHSRTQVKRLVPITFVHEFQHMISFNQHVLARGGEAEVLWLNEGLSHFAEELGGRSYLPADNTTFSRFVIGDLYNAYQYLDDPGGAFLLAPQCTGCIGTLAERGSAWLFMRYITDRFRTDTTFAATAAFTRKLEETTLTGADNVVAQTGVAFDTLVVRWTLANWVSDLPGFTAPPELTYTSWAFRTTYAGLHGSDPANFPKSFPLVPTASAGNLTSLSGTLRAGSGLYDRALQGPGAAGFQVRYGGTGRIQFVEYPALLPPQVVPRLAIIRIR